MRFLFWTIAVYLFSYRTSTQYWGRSRKQTGRHAMSSPAKPVKRRDGCGRHRYAEPTPLLRQILIFKNKAVQDVDKLHTGPLELVA